MKVSLNWIKEYTSFELPPVDELVARIGARLGAVEEVVDLGERYVGVPIVKVVSCEPLPNSDHLHRCLVDDAGAVHGAERNTDGLVQVLTGAPNVHEGMLAVWLPPGATVPVTFGKDPFVLSSRTIRGAISHGMLASAKELGIGDSHEGLLDLTTEPTTTPGGMPIKPGANFAEVFGLNDHIINIENKMFTHRPDCFGQLGVAREIAGIFGHAFQSPARYTTFEGITAGNGLGLEVDNHIPESVPRFMAVALKNVEVRPSPLWLQATLACVGVRPVSNVVDVTNYIMLLTGQPMHAYDYDKVGTGKLGARMAERGETLALLNGKTIKLDSADVVITDGEKPIGLAGVMGGADTEVSDHTKHIILECASFDMYAIRRTSMRHGLFTDAVTRFNKGQSPLQNPATMRLAIEQLRALAGGETASVLVDSDHTNGRASVHQPVRVTPGFINARLGLNLSAGEIARLLRNVEFDVAVGDSELTVTAPFWRTDIEIPEDIVEEVGRLHGYDRLPLELPTRDITPAPKDALLEAKATIRARLAGAGGNEVLTYSFVHGDLLKRADQDPAKAYQLSNALSPDLQYFRLSLTPSLLDKVHQNIKAGYDAFALFEIGTSHYKGEMDANDPGVPNEDKHVALVIAYGDKRRPAGSPFYHARKYLAHITDIQPDTLTPLVDFDLSQDDWGKQLTAPYEPQRSAVLLRDGQIWGVVGEFRPGVRKALKLPAYTAGFEIHLEAITAPSRKYLPLPRFPKVTQDITLKVAASMQYAGIQRALGQAIGANVADSLHVDLEPLGIFQPAGDSPHKNVTFRLTVASFERTLTDLEVAKILDQAASSMREKLGAERV